MLTRYEEFKNWWTIVDWEDIEDLIDKILTDNKWVVDWSKIKYTKTIGTKDVLISTDKDSGKILTITYTK